MKHPDFVNSSKSKLSSLESTLGITQKNKSNSNFIKKINLNNYLENNFDSKKENFKITIIGGGEEVEKRKKNICSWMNRNTNDIVIFTSAKYLNISDSINCKKFLTYNMNEIERIKKIQKNTPKQKIKTINKFFNSLIYHEEIDNSAINFLRKLIL